MEGLYKTLPIGQQVIFSVSNATIVATMYKVKFVAEVRVSSSSGINPNTATDLIGTFKTTPNNAGVGIFDLRPILETFVKPDHEPYLGSPLSAVSEYKGISAATKTFPIHLVDKFSLNNNTIKFFAVRFLVEYSVDPTGSVVPPAHQVDSAEYTMFNGVLQYDDILDLFDGDYGYDMGDDYYLNSPTSSFLTTAPTTQYARLEDYGTLPFLNNMQSGTFLLDNIVISYIYPGGSLTDTVDWSSVNGGNDYQGSSSTRLAYFGAFPANLQNWSANFADAVTSGMTHYNVTAIGNVMDSYSQTYTINILCPNNKGYEAVRLAWLNKWGGWDYYTFNMKSTRSVTTKRIPYTQLEGTWNESTFKISGYKGGKKNFRVNSTERIKLNTDFVTEAEGVWFEQLINSPEVYVLEGFQSDPTYSSFNNYVQPATITNSNYVRKTIANDKLMQYTIEIEKSKMKRTQSV
jgi:hypothetical protein